MSTNTAFPFKLPVRVETGRMPRVNTQFIVAADSELVLSTHDATPNELEFIVQAINAYPQRESNDGQD